MQHREENLQIAIAKWLFMQYPKLLWNHNPSGALLPKKKIGGNWVSSGGRRLKMMGSRPGIPDIMIYRPTFYHNMRLQYCGLAIELKVVYPSGAKGVLSSDQKKVLEQLKDSKWKTAVCYNFDEAVKLIEDYLS